MFKTSWSDIIIQPNELLILDNFPVKISFLGSTGSPLAFSKHLKKHWCNFPVKCCEMSSTSNTLHRQSVFIFVWQLACREKCFNKLSTWAKISWNSLWIYWLLETFLFKKYEWLIWRIIAWNSPVAKKTFLICCQIKAVFFLISPSFLPGSTFYWLKVF